MKRIILIGIILLLLGGGCKVIFPILKIKFHSFSELKELVPAQKKEHLQNKTEKMDEIYDRMFREGRNK